MRRRQVLAAAVAVPVLAACGSSAPAAAPAVVVTPSADAVQSCPSPGPPAPEWPAAVPDSLPKPPGSSITGTQLVGPATYVQFTSPVSLREGTLFVVRELTAAGYTLARGDAEANEADAPFSGPTIVGALRLTRTAACLTSWTLAVEARSQAGTSTNLIPYHPGAAASPLPFG